MDCSVNGTGTTGSPSGLIPYTRVNSRWDKALNMEIKSIQVLEGTMNEPLKKNSVGWESLCNQDGKFRDH